MGRIPQHFIDELIARTDIVELIGARVPLKKSGREYKACCPFHAEKTPSFWVSPDKQFYHCFGCGKHGTALGFLMDHDHMAFPEAVEELATRLGLEVPHEGGVDRAAQRADEPLYELMARVARFYTEQLVRAPRAREYLAQRGLTAATQERFAIGYAPDSWNELLRHFGGSDAERKRLLDGGLIIERERGAGREGERYYDRFRDRVMFPIRDARGRVIGFGGRVIDAGEPKYLNSPETMLFHKGRELYGLYETRRARRNLERLVVVEGYMDAVSLHQAGVDYTVATLGTATTAEHFRRIFRLVSAVVFAFDGDRARRCPRRVRGARSAFFSFRRVRIRTRSSVPRVLQPSKDDLRSLCPCRNTWYGSSPSRATSARRTGARASRNRHGRSSRVFPKVCIVSCCSSGWRRS